MNLFRLAALAAALLATPAAAQYQVPDHSVPIGRGGNVQGFKNAAPGAATRPLVSNGPSSDPTFQQLPNSGLVPGAANTVKGSLDGTTTADLPLVTCSAIYQFTQWVTGTGWRCGMLPVMPSRAIAATLNLSAFTAVQTQGYALPGDGGGAMFRNVLTTPFRDSFITAVSVAGNGVSGCTNGAPAVRGSRPTGGSGTNLTVNFTVAGNVVTAVSIEDTGGNGYTVGNVLTATVPGCANPVTITVSTVSTPNCSFSDVASNHLQLVLDAGNFLNVRQCGAKVDYAGNDATATDDRVAIQSAYSFASDIRSPTIDGGGSAGGRVIHPPGNSLVCGSVSLLLPNGVAPEGHNIWASTLKMCAAWSQAVHFMTICDPDTHSSCFASYLRNLTLYSPFTQSGDANIAMVYSNNIQQVDVFDRVAIYAGRKQCINLEVGYGGAALLGMQNVECTPGSGGINAGIKINYGTTLVTMRNVHVETGGVQAINGMEILGGFISLVGFHSEGIVTPIYVNIPGGTVNGYVRLLLLSGGGGCTDLVLKQGGSAANSVTVGGAVYNGCTNTYNNGGAGSGAIIVGPDVTF